MKFKPHFQITKYTFVDLVRAILIGGLVGMIVSVTTVLLIELVEWLNHYFYLTPKSRVISDNLFKTNLYTILVPTIGGLIVGLMSYGLTNRQPQSITETIYHATLSKPFSLFKDGLVNGLAGIISLGCGASVGIYGHVAHMGSVMGQAISRLILPNQSHLNVGLACGVAAAISAVFNAPVAGTIFAHEVILRHYSLNTFAPVTIASVLGYLVTNQIFDHTPVFQFINDSAPLSIEFLAFAVIGMGGALVANFFMRSLLFFRDLRIKLNLPLPLNPMIAGFLTGIVGLWIPEIMGIGKESIRLATIDNGFLLSQLSILVIMKIIITSLCIGFGFVGGIFSPSVFIGITFGAFCGLSAQMLFGITPTALAFYSFCGMVAVTAPTIGAPISAIILVLELTRSYELATAVMISVSISCLISTHLFGRSYFDRMLKKRDVDLDYGRDLPLLKHTPIEDQIERNPCFINSNSDLASTRQKMLTQNLHEIYIVDDKKCLQGTINLVDIASLIERNEDMNLPVSYFMRECDIVFYPHTSIWDAMQALQDFVGEGVPVVNNENDKQLVGVIHESNIIKAYMNRLYQLRKEENLPATLKK